MTDRTSQKGRSEEVGRVSNLGNDDAIVCGAGSCQPSFMQSCARIQCFTALYSLAGLFTSTLSIYINSQITTLERQFGFSSSISGLLMSCNDLGYLLTTLPLSHLARRVHIPRALAASTLLFGLSGLICTIPFFATRDSLSVSPRALTEVNASASGSSASFRAPLCVLDVMANSRSDNVSQMVNLSTRGEESCAVEGPRRKAAISEEWQGLAIACLALGMMFQGFGKSPRQTFVGTYIDDNVPKTKTTLYLGIISCLSIFGPALAFTLGGVFTTMYITLEDTGMTTRDPRWIGAWWLGFVVFGICGIFAAIPLVFFPRRLRPQPELKVLQDKRKSATKGRQFIHGIKEFLRSLLRLVLTPVYILIVIGNCCVLFSISGMMAFLPKYIETQFTVPPWQANITIGVLNVMAASVGTFIGGYVTSHFKLPPMTCLKMMLTLSAVCTCIVTSSFALGCDQPQIDMGVTAMGDSGSITNTSQRCQSSCQCDESRYFPTCGANGVTYFSPCHAGCSENRGVSYGNCSCITMPSNTSHPTAEAVPGLCSQSCNMLYPYVILSFFGAMASTMSMMPSFVVSVRSVAESDKPLAIGFSAFLCTLLGWFPGPVLFGRVVDTTCLLWTSGCAGAGSCSMYDLRAFRFLYHGLYIGARVANLVFFVIAFVVATRLKRPFHAHCEAEEIVPTTQEGRQLMSGENMKNSERVFNEMEDEEPLGSERIFKAKSPL